MGRDEKNGERSFARDIRRHLGGLSREIAIDARGTVASTNDEAKALIVAGEKRGDLPFGTVIVANEQTAGRGRRGRVFASPAADSVYMSFILKPAAAAADTLPVTIAAAVAVCEAIEARTSARPLIKWVNDIYIEGKKVCGILAEAVSGADGGIAGIVLGVGVNINVPPESFPEELRGIAASLRIEKGDRARFTAELIRRVRARCDGLPGGTSPIQAYRERSLVVGAQIIVIGSGGFETPAVAEDIADDGALLVRYADGRRESLHSGEINAVSIRPSL
jgi:BirA family biotin operon repressor/biotin-[acetyl-CoA-carboxylase] ligase